MPESAGGADYMRLLQALSGEEILALLGGFCEDCQALVKTRVHDIINKQQNEISVSNCGTEKTRGSISAGSSSVISSENGSKFKSCESSSLVSSENGSDSKSSGSSSVISSENGSESRSCESLSLSSSENGAKSAKKMPHKQKRVSWGLTPTPESVHSSRQLSNGASGSPASVNSKKQSPSGSDIPINDGHSDGSSGNKPLFSQEEKEWLQFVKVGRKKDFVHIERINAREVNVLKGLELHTGVFNAEEQKMIVERVYKYQKMGRKGRLRDRTYSEPKKWMRGKGRVTIQFGCCYNYAVDKSGNPPGIIREEEVDPLPRIFKHMIVRMIRYNVLPQTCVPNSCIVNIYDEGDCIPPHIDHHDFLRPFCTVSFLAECNIVFGSSLKVVNAGEFSGPVSIPLPVGSVLVLNGNGADIAKHCIPAVPAKRISITFRKMDESKLPYSFLPDPDLEEIEPFPLDLALSLTQRFPSLPASPVKQKQIIPEREEGNGRNENQNHQPSDGGGPFLLEKDFPPLGSSNSGRGSNGFRSRKR